MGERPLGCASSGIDLWADEILLDPYPTYAELRASGPVVWLERYGVAAVARFEQVQAVLADWRRFSSARGVGMDDELNSCLGENTICSDPPAHDQYRKPLMEQLWSDALTPDIPEVRATAERFAERAAGTGAGVGARTGAKADAGAKPQAGGEAGAGVGSFDAVADLCRPYSLTVVADLLGLPDEGRDLYPELAERAFNLFGPAGDRAADGLSAAAELVNRALGADADALASDRRGAQLWEIGMPGLIVTYTWPGIDTTVNALASAVLLFAQHPDQWTDLRADRSLIPSAFNEVLRLHSPVHHFTRHVTEDVDIAGITLRAGTKVLVMYGAANRDERRFVNPDTFDIRRPGPSHVAFGRGVHLCVGMHLARIEAHSLFDTLADRVERFELAGEPRWTANSTLHGLGRLPICIIPAR